MSATEKKRRLAVCANCAMLKKLYGRNLCSTCRGKAFRDGTLLNFPRVNRPLSEVLEDWETLKLRGMSMRQASEFMGYAPYTLSRLVYRARNEYGTVIK